MRDGSRGIPSWRGILRRRCRRYSVMVALAHFGQIPPMGIHILALLRFSLAYHPFHTRCDAHSLSLSQSFRFFRLSSLPAVISSFLSLALYVSMYEGTVRMTLATTTTTTTMRIVLSTGDVLRAVRSSGDSASPSGARAPPVNQENKSIYLAVNDTRTHLEDNREAPFKKSATCMSTTVMNLRWTFVGRQMARDGINKLF